MDDAARQLSLAVNAEPGRSPSKMMNLGGLRPVLVKVTRA